MINRQARDQAAELLELFCLDRIAYKDLIKRYPRCKDDAAVWLIIEYITLKHKKRGYWFTLHWKARKEDKRLFARFVAFLRSDLEYAWPVPGPLWWHLQLGIIMFVVLIVLHYSRSLLANIGFVALMLLVYGIVLLANQRFQRSYKSAGDITVWPFTSKSENTAESYSDHDSPSIKG